MGRPIGRALAEKHRSAGIVSGDLFVGDVAGATCIIVDDLISTGGTLVRAARAAGARSARRVLACVTHGLFMPGAETALADPAIDRVIATDSVPAFRLPVGPVRDKLDIVPAAPFWRRPSVGSTMISRSPICWYPENPLKTPRDLAV
jgi:ribose-phosphate pyrophosphokinase